MRNLLLLISLFTAYAVNGQLVQHLPPMLNTLSIKHNFVELEWSHPYAYEFEIRTAVPNMITPTFISLHRTKMFHDERARGQTNFTQRVRVIAQESTFSVRALFGTNMTEFSNPIVLQMNNPPRTRHDAPIPIPPVIVPPLP